MSEKDYIPQQQEEKPTTRSMDSIYNPNAGNPPPPRK